ncbi:cupredoxin domain-containing protein [candidate division WWE3 bacterium]|uniref:Cupredoxin domain-containing protein n=1 Tax=candidate division WWE3 bacterium TaxID=2053526 RepID=A0A955RPJ0_UNCKA|nr:cupredoxin domain-containing protein [candidate division WWE3 bacterium]
METQDNPTKRYIIYGLLAIIIGLSGYLYSTDNSERPTSNGSPSPTPTKTSTLTPTVGSVEAAEDIPGEMLNEDQSVKEFTIEAGSFYYTPNMIEVQKGDTVRIIIESVDMMHDFTLDAFGVQTPVTPAGSSNTVEFVADTIGSFEFYCSVGQHRQLGQVGTLIVTE